MLTLFLLSLNLPEIFAEAPERRQVLNRSIVDPVDSSPLVNDES